MTPVASRSQPRTILAASLIAAVLLAGEAGLVLAAQGQRETAPGDTRRGKIIFVKYCAGCHGTGGQGDGYRLLGPNPANLTAPATQQKPDAALLATIHEGRPNMPSWQSRLSDEESRDVLAYVRTLGGNSGGHGRR